LCAGAAATYHTSAPATVDQPSDATSFEGLL
jgi:hypothetical protein